MYLIYKTNTTCQHVESKERTGKKKDPCAKAVHLKEIITLKATKKEEY